MPTKLLQKRLRFLGAVEVRRDQSTSKQCYAFDASFSCLCGRASVQHLSYLRSNTEAITQKLRKTTCDDFLTKHLQSSVGLSTGRVIHRAGYPQGGRYPQGGYPQAVVPMLSTALGRLSPGLAGYPQVVSGLSTVLGFLRGERLPETGCCGGYPHAVRHMPPTCG